MQLDRRMVMNNFAASLIITYSLYSYRHVTTAARNYNDL